jgi:riboflavin synthase
MFTGIVEGTAVVKRIEEVNGNRRMALDFGRRGSSIRGGESVSINGVCLSAVKRRGSIVFFDVIAETLRKTNLGMLKEGDRVNFERSITMNDLLGGHLVTGHVDGTGRIAEKEEEGISLRLKIEVPSSLSEFILEKGLIAVDGISLTPANVTDGSFNLYLIPDTMRKTTLAEKNIGYLVNIELDVFGKYIHKFVNAAIERLK